MLFEFGAHSGLLLPFVVPGLVLAGHLLVRAARAGHLPDGLLALLLLLNVLPVTQWMLGYAGWYDSHDGYSTFMFYVPWQPWLLCGPVFYLYFRSLTNQAFELRRHRWHLLPGLLYAGLFAGAALYDLGWSRGLHGRELPFHYGTKGEAANWLDFIGGLASWLGYALMLGYGLPRSGSFGATGATSTTTSRTRPGCGFAGCATCWWPRWRGCCCGWASRC